MESGPIGIFDSGYGGLTVMKEIVKELPEYDYVYLGDNARAPYGSRSFETVYEYTLQCVKTLFSKGCPLVILACNTASAKALRTIQQKDLPRIAPQRRVLGVIRPTTEVIGDYSTSKHIGILATEGTVNSGSYTIEIEKFFPEIKVSQQACPMWVPLVENNELDSEGANYFIKKNLEQLFEKDKNIDTLLLGCTHYPLLEKNIKKQLPQNINIVSQGNIVAHSLREYLHKHKEMNERCTKSGMRTFYTSDDADIFSKRAELFFGEQVSATTVHIVS
jgi:glutamate racemase